MDFAKCNNMNILNNALMDEYPDVRFEYRVSASTRILSYAKLECYQSLKNIYDFLLKLDSSENAKKKNRIGQWGKLQDCDIVFPKRRQVIEFDERHHFTKVRGETFQFYPNNLRLGFNKKEYASHCIRKTNPKDIRKIWYDVLRDFLPLTKGFQPTVRIIEHNKDYSDIDPMSLKRSVILEKLGLGKRIAPIQRDSLKNLDTQDEKKNTILLDAHKKYGTAYWNHKIPASTKPLDHKTGPTSQLYELFTNLTDYCRYEIQVKNSMLSGCDIFIPSEMKVIELDEEQHFSLARRKSLELYKDLNIDFNKDEYIALCKKIQAVDITPKYRDGQRAWFDTLKDHLPMMHPDLKPVQRIACVEA